MAQKSTRKTNFDINADDLVQVLTNAEFQVAQRKTDDAVVDARFDEVTRTDTRLVFDLRSTEYDRGVTGVNKNKKIEAVTHVEWDLKARKGKWSYTTPSTDRFELTGDQTVEASGNGSILIAGTQITVRIPLVGKKVEKMVMNGMDKGRDRYDALVREYAKKLL